MDITRAKELLEGLADGVNPITGEVLSQDDSCNQVEIVRALNTILRHLEDVLMVTGNSEPENAGKPWTKAEDEILCRMFDRGCSKKEICTYFKRSSGGIAARLVKLGKIADRGQFKRG